MIIENLTTLKINQLTQAQYEAALAAGTINENELYMTPDSSIIVTDIVDDLTTNSTDKPLSAAQGVALKTLIDGITVPTKVSELQNDAGYLTQHQDISGKANVSGQVFTGTVEAPVVKTTSYFYTPALVNEGDLTKYYHRLNLGYAKHDYWEFHEYGGDYRFYKNTAGTDDGKSLIANITSTGSNFVGQLKEGGVRVYSPNNKPTAADLGITIPEAYVLPVANQNTLGGIKVGAGLSITAEGVLSAAPTVVTASLLASAWNAATKTYSFETTYPNASYDIEVALNSTATTAQAEAFNGAQIVGSAASNTIKAYGDVPTVDIPIILKVVTK